jgi:NAD(P)H-dependent nitrite reductase small subunit
MSTEYVVGKLQDLPQGRGIAVSAGKRVIAVFRVGDRVYAMHNRCPHKGASLCDGLVDAERGQVRCPWHNWPWQLDSGAFAVDPREHIRTYDVRVVDDTVILRV